MDFTKDIYINKDTIYEDSEMVLLYKGFLFSNNLANEVYMANLITVFLFSKTLLNVLL